MKITSIAILLGCLYAPLAWSQCAPGVPSAGNPGCIPPDQSNSPYYQGGSAQQQAPQTAPQVQAVWADRWGAIAVDYKTGQAGTIEGQTSKSKADQTALSDCAKNGSPNCEVILSFHNQCAAIAWGAGKMGYSGGPTTDVAEQKAIDRCGQGDACKIVYSKCSFAERVR
ncbi:DUF4189 domain-containing protein [Dyella silvatica]|uniref:DUF4189 domain-containing protein n=1 Tax=Dyella silvatica TaxID=2992128 RepID=UPI003CCE166C